MQDQYEPRIYSGNTLIVAYNPITVSVVLRQQPRIYEQDVRTKAERHQELYKLHAINFTFSRFLNFYSQYPGYSLKSRDLSNPVHSSFVDKNILLILYRQLLLSQPCYP